MPHYTITLHHPDQASERFPVQAGQTLLAGAEAGLTRPVPVGCRGGGCGLCRVRILQGPYQRQCMSRRHVGPGQAQLGYALACKVLPEGDLDIELATPCPETPAARLCNGHG
ncbi:ferredoxin [Zobellella endophytica]|uniref:Ferredoxin n=1 Tax=Zobellella endophytica TaxID=2116700 RepID=A0A2P7R879_9GAMM|nr:2Fe-2S iron-sulfur cluster-binding protein [Zobellella endophytica]PSJ46409.1 ferredoxin [Zobellella endophytica]